MSVQILVLSPDGAPNRWVTIEKAVYYIFKGHVAWSPTDVNYVVRGGVNAVTNQASTLKIPSIIAVKNTRHSSLLPQRRKTPRAIFSRDNNTCAYCGNRFSHANLTQDHIIPKGQGGSDDWTNLISSCFPCNNRKGNRTPEQAQMPLLFEPYAPSRAEYLKFSQPVKLACQEEWINNYV